MELKNVLVVIVGLFIVLVSLSLFNDDLTGNASIDLSYQGGSIVGVPKGNQLNVQVRSNTNGILKNGQVVLAGANCATAVAKSSFDFCPGVKDQIKIGNTYYNRCQGTLNLNIATNALERGSSYNIRYKEFTTTSISPYRCSTNSFTIRRY